MSDPRRALEAIGLLPDIEIDIGDAALQLARVDAPGADWQAARRICRTWRARPSLCPAHHAVRACRIAVGLLATRLWLFGRRGPYDDLANANLIRVTERRRGLPVALGIIWLHTARAAGWARPWRGLPGAFPGGAEGRSVQAVLDVFHGGVTLDARGSAGLLKRIEGEDAELRPGLLRPMSARARAAAAAEQHRSRRLQVGDLAGALACTEDMLRIAPDHAELWRQAALMNQRLDRVAAALRCFERFLELVPDGEAAARVRSVMDELRTRLN